MKTKTGNTYLVWSLFLVVLVIELIVLLGYAFPVTAQSATADTLRSPVRLADQTSSLRSPMTTIDRFYTALQRGYAATVLANGHINFEQVDYRTAWQLLTPSLRQQLADDQAKFIRTWWHKGPIQRVSAIAMTQIGEQIELHYTVEYANYPVLGRTYRHHARLRFDPTSQSWLIDNITIR